ncbi:MAG: orotidine-5'-phosphate decarboxylase [Alphaproteobacteria bacterium]|nr:orotidine-5'-phosphate decarboxylase [Alphaproteobacteria bacterium]
MSAGARIFCAIDTADAVRAVELADALSDVVGGLKLGLEFFAARGPAGVAAIAERRLPLFLDLKLHDIPHTVAAAVRACLPIEPFLLTIHAGGGPAMIAAAAEAAREAAGTRPRIIAVTVLTSLSDDDLDRVGQSRPALDQVRRLAALAQESGADGVVCSPRETAALRQDCGEDFVLVVPGIRPPGAAAGDQKRVTTPAEALGAGASYLVIGRPITAAPDPAAAARAIIAGIDSGSGG